MAMPRQAAATQLSQTKNRAGAGNICRAPNPPISSAQTPAGAALPAPIGGFCRLGATADGTAARAASHTALGAGGKTTPGARAGATRPTEPSKTVLLAETRGKATASIFEPGTTSTIGPSPRADF